jgi:hypothetical protein
LYMKQLNCKLKNGLKGSTSKYKKLKLTWITQLLVKVIMSRNNLIEVWITQVYYIGWLVGLWCLTPLLNCKLKNGLKGIRLIIKFITL